MKNLKEIKNISFLQLALTISAVVALLVSNVITARQIQFPFDIVISGGMFVFPITYILSDVFSEVYGYRWSRITSYISFTANLVMVIIFSLVIYAPAPGHFINTEAYQVVLGSTPRILFASLLAYMVGDLVNDKIFKKMKEKHPNSHKRFKLRAIVSSFAGEAIDSMIFLPIAFLGQMPLEVMIKSLIFRVVIKVSYESLILPITSLVVNKVSKYENNVVAAK